MKTGKLPIGVLERLLAGLPAGDSRVVVGPRVGEDAAAISFGDVAVVAGMDPITFATDLIGWYAVQVNANDVAVMGARPRWFLAALLLPPDSPDGSAEEVFGQLGRACEELSITPVGGHTEVTGAVSQPVVVGCMLGEASSQGIVTTGGARPGDVVLLRGSAGVEGTAVLAREAGEALSTRGVELEQIERAKRFLFDPGISVVRPALAAASVGVSAMHDPTEGGIASGLLELARASAGGIEVDLDRVPVLPVTQLVCEALGLDPLGLIGSGALLITTGADDVTAVQDALRAAGDDATVIGRVLPESEGLWAERAGKRHPLPVFERDEVARFLDGLSGPA
ncbi:MAG: AIR synthase family protein [Armatimonadota bacterium]